MRVPKPGEVVEVYSGPDGWKRATVISARSYQVWPPGVEGVRVIAEDEDGQTVYRSGNPRKGFSFRWPS